MGQRRLNDMVVQGERRMATEEAEERLEDMGEYGSGSAPRKSVRRGKEVPAMPSFLRVAG